MKAQKLKVLASKSEARRLSFYKETIQEKLKSLKSLPVQTEEVKQKIILFEMTLLDIESVEPEDG